MRTRTPTESDISRNYCRLAAWQLLAVCTLLMANPAGSTCSAQLVIDDFASGWTNFHNFSDSGALLDISSNESEYTIGMAENVTGPGASLSCWEPSFDGGFSDGILRVTARSHTAAGYPLILMRLPSVNVVPGSYGMSATPSSQGFFALGRSESPPAFLATLPGNFGPHQDWVFEAGTIGNEISMKVWRVGDPAPLEPQMTAFDSKYSDGGFCLTAAMWPGYTDQPSVTFWDLAFIRPTDRLVGGWKSIGREVKNDAAFELTSTDTWFFELDATNEIADALEVTGSLNINQSTLAVRILEGELKSRDHFDLLDFQEQTGEFATMELPQLSDSLQWYTNDLYADGSISVTIRGDFDNSGVLDAPDIDLLSEAVGFDGNSIFDLTDDRVVNDADRAFWVSELAGTYFGDANLDQQVDFADFLILSASFSKDGGWEMGDFDGSGGVDFADFLRLSANFGATSGMVATIPEPRGSALLVIASLALLSVFRPRNVSRRTIE